MQIYTRACIACTRQLGPRPSNNIGLNRLQTKKKINKKLKSNPIGSTHDLVWAARSDLVLINHAMCAKVNGLDLNREE